MVDRSDDAAERRPSRSGKKSAFIIPPLIADTTRGAAVARPGHRALDEARIVLRGEPRSPTPVRLGKLASPLAGLRLMMSVRRPEHPDFYDELAFEETLSIAATLQTVGLDTVLVAVGGALDEGSLLKVRRMPGVSFWPEAATTLDGGAHLLDIAHAAGADLMLLHDPRLVPERRDSLPILVACTNSPIIRWKTLHGDKPAPDRLRLDAILEKRGLIAADRVLAPSRAFAEALAVEHNLPRRPIVAAPFSLDILASNLTNPARDLSDRTYALSACRLFDDAADAVTLDRAASRLDGAVFAAGPTVGPHARAPGFSDLHCLGPLAWDQIDRLFSRSPVFVSTARARTSGRLVFRAAARGCALILSDLPVHHEMWRGAATFVKPGDAEGFAAAIRRAIEDFEHRSAMMDASLRRARLLAGMRRGDALHDLLVSALSGARLTAAE
ncbi:MAG: glycosyltransferase [Beijerinckiaceae bacterium]|nr:glycosyltransferase [Beijerinckiaceae bacterium]